MPHRNVFGVCNVIEEVVHYLQNVIGEDVSEWHFAELITQTHDIPLPK